jgi:predicted transcriptional regulator
MVAKQKLLNYLSKTDGYNTFTVAQARSMFKIQNVSARIDELRKEGHMIYTNEKTLDDGRKIKFYKLGKPSKKVIAAGIQALRQQGERAFT